MTTIYFLAYLALLVGIVGVLTRRYLSPIVLAGLAAWLVYVGLLSYFGVVRDPNLRPPGAFLVVLPVFFFIFFTLGRSSTGARWAGAVPLALLLGLQSFRVGVELLLHQLWLDGLAPQMLTFAGSNLDIFIGASAPLIAWLSTKGRFGSRLALAWNGLGLISLINVATRSALTTPGPLNLIHTEVPNLAIGTFPFTYIAGFFAPLAVMLHVLAIRALLTKLKNAENSHDNKVNLANSRAGIS